MANQDKPIGPIRIVGRVGYQVYTRVQYGEVKYRSKVGRPWKDPKNNKWTILAFREAESTRDYDEAQRRSARELEQLYEASFRDDALKGEATTSTLDSPVELDFELDNQQPPLPNELKLAGS